MTPGRSNRFFAAAAVSAVLLSCGCVTDDDDYGFGIAVGDRLPSFSVVMDDGSTVCSDDLAGEVSVITFFNTSCPDCQAELPVLQQSYLSHGERACFICISREEDDRSVAAYWHDNDLTLPYSAQSDRRVYNLFASSVIPRIYVVSPDMIVTASFTDKDMPSEPVLYSAIMSACK